MFDLDLDWEIEEYLELGPPGLEEVRCDELGQTQWRRCGMKKSDDANARIHSTEYHSLTSSAPTDLRPDLPRRRLRLCEEGQI